MKHLLSPLLCVALLPAQNLTLQPAGGGLGQSLSYAIAGGGANQGFIFATSLTRASIPLRLFDGRDTRNFGIGLDLTSIWVFGQLDASGARTLAATLPNLPGLAGAAILNQALTHPGTAGRMIDGMSEVVVVPMDIAGVFKSQTSKLSAPRQFATTIPLPDGRELLVGGADGTILWQKALRATAVFDPATRGFSQGPDLIQARSTHTQTRLKDGRYLLVGGVDTKNVATATCEVFDPTTGKFSAVGSLTYKRVFHQAILMADGRVVVLGGFADLGALLGTQKALESGIRQTEIFDPKTDTWTVGASLRYGRGAPGVEDIGNGKVLVIGGVVKGTFAPDLNNTCELYDMAANTVASARSITTRTAFTTTFQLPGNRVLVAGGDAGPRDSIRNYTNKATATCMIYDAASNSWSNVASLPVPSAGGGKLILRDGTLVLTTGGDNTLYWPHGNKSLYSFDPKTNTWATLGTLITGRNSAATIELQAGGLAVIGGGTFNAARSTDSWELLVR